MAASWGAARTKCNEFQRSPQGEQLAARSPARPVPARPDAAAHRPPAAPVLCACSAGGRRCQGRRRPGAETAARRNHHAPQMPVRCGHWLPRFDRQSRTLSGGEVQRINLRPPALGTSLVNTCLCWTSPALACPAGHATASSAMLRLRDAGNTWWWWARPQRDAAGRPHDRHGPRPCRWAGRSCLTAPRLICKPTPSPAPAWATRKHRALASSAR